jgi:hypothetical protein
MQRRRDICATSFTVFLPSFFEKIAMKNSIRTLLLIATATATVASPLAHADFLSALKNAATKEMTPAKETSSTDNGLDLSSLSGLLGGNAAALTPSTASNAAGILQYCIKNNMLSSSATEKVKNQLMGKLGIETETQNKNSDFQDGIKGILHGQGNGNIDLSNLGAGSAKLKEQITEKACDLVLDNAKSFL